MSDEGVGISTQDAGSQIASLLLDDPTPTPAADGVREVKFTAKAKPAKAAKVEEAPIPLTGNDGTPDEGAEEPKDEEKPAEPTVEDEDDDEETPEPKKFKVKADGIELEVDEGELVKGYSRTKDYTQKTQALAEERRKFVEEDLAPVRAERQLYAERLDALHTAVTSLLPETEPDWNEVRTRTTPEEFTEAFAQWRGQMQRVEKIKAEQARVRDLQVQDEQRMTMVRLVEEKAKLEAALPDLKDPEKGKGLRDDLTAYARSLGFTEEGLSAVEDHRLLVMLDKARRYDEAQARKPKIEDKIDRALETIKPSAPRLRPKNSETERAKTRLAETGRVEDAATLISKMLQ